MSLYSVVVPVYYSAPTLHELYQRVANVFDNVIRQDFELILVDDGSKDGSYEVMKELRAADRRVRIIQMARNFGQHPALLCGFAYVKGDYIVTIDDDLQHPPEEIPKLIDAMNTDPSVDVVIARYQGRKHGWIRKLGTRLSVYATSKMLGKDKDLEITSFRLIKHQVVESILKIHVRKPQIGNMLVQTSSHIVNVDVNHDARKYGKSGYSFVHLVKDLIYDITSHSAFPLIVVRNLGLFSFLISIALGIFYLIRYFAFGVSVQGFTTLVLLLTAYSGITLLSIGIIGQYLMNILEETRKLPLYAIREKDV